MQKLGLYWRLMRFDKPIGIALLLWPTLWALWLASAGVPNFSLSLIFVAGVVVMRAAGCVMNDIADRKYDHAVARTRLRPLATGELSVKEAFGLLLVLCVCALILVLLLNTLTVLLSMIGLVLAALYPFAKRYTFFPQVVLGAAFSWSIPMVYTAVTNSIATIPWSLFCAAWLWPVAYDTAYAMVDREDDLAIGLKSTAIRFGQYDRWAIGLIQSVVCVLLAWTGWTQQLEPGYFVCLGLAVLWSLVLQWMLRTRDRESCFRVFRYHTVFGLLVFIGCIAGV